MTAQVGAHVREIPEKAAVAIQSRATAGTRLLFIDNLRVFLTILVVLHHLSITYGSGLGSWYYHDSSTPLTQILFSLFIIVNQGYFMGLFFLISGYFSVASLERKGLARFIKDRLIRLGIPLVVFSLLINTLPLYISSITQGAWSGSFWQFSLNYWRSVDYQTGPMWFVEALLVFSIIYAGGRAIWNKVHKHLPDSPVLARPLTHTQILIFVVAMAVAIFTVRIYIPAGITWHNWELGQFPQYVFMYAAGILAYRYNWLPDVDTRIQKPWKIVAVVCLVVLVPMLLIGGGTGNLDAYNGGLTWQSGMTSTWFAIYPAAMSLLLLDVFRKRIDIQGWLGKLLSKNAYTVYIIHAPVIVYLAYLARGVIIDPFIKFFLMAPIAVILCFLVSQIIRRMPMAEKVL
jgi:glucan biosynthesis protein C